MDPVQKHWMYQNWVEDQQEKAELAKNTAYLIGSFWNPEAVKQLMGEGKTFVSTEEDLDESSRMVRQTNLQALNKEPKKRKRKHRLKG